jgi:uncharacterized protein YcgI (DUF1989 family)
VPVQSDGSFVLTTSPAQPGDRISLLAKVDVLLVVSACPMDLIPISGGGEPRQIDIRVQ